MSTCCTSKPRAAWPRWTAGPHLGSSRAQRQQAVLEQFRAGELNTLISTAVAEEGLDLTRCALVRPGAASCPCPEAFVHLAALKSCCLLSLLLFPHACMRKLVVTHTLLVNSHPCDQLALPRGLQQSMCCCRCCASTRPPQRWSSSSRAGARARRSRAWSSWRRPAMRRMRGCSRTCAGARVHALPTCIPA